MYNELSCNQYCLNNKTNPSYEKSMSSSTSSLVEVHIVRKGDEYYNKGRKLAENVYRQVWGTENLLDGNHYGIVVSQNGKVLGNLNIQLKRPGKSLKSEVFFGDKHWKEYSDANSSEIVELSALAIAQDAPKKLRRPIMKMLILGVGKLCLQQGIKFLVTVQHDYLIRILSKSLRLPFYQSQKITRPQGSTPRDGYWNRPKLPGVYYLETSSSKALAAYYSFYDSLNSLNILFHAEPVANNNEHSNFWQKYFNSPPQKEENILERDYSQLINTVYCT